MDTSPRRGGGHLRAFRLGEIPIELRLRAVRAAASMKVTDDQVRPEDRLFAHLRDHDHNDPEVRLRRIAENPSPRVYWITEKAWTRVMGA